MYIPLGPLTYVYLLVLILDPVEWDWRRPIHQEIGWLPLCLDWLSMEFVPDDFLVNGAHWSGLSVSHHGMLNDA